MPPERSSASCCEATANERSAVQRTPHPSTGLTATPGW